MRNHLRKGDIMADFRFIHASDLHLGRRFAAMPEEIRPHLAEARHGAIPRLAGAARAAGADPATLEHYEVVADETGSRAFRYMKAIPAQGPCLTCHGTNIPAEVTAALEGAYPQDQATGFAEGDIRGAFTIIQPIDG